MVYITEKSVRSVTLDPCGSWTYFRPSRVTHATTVEAGMAESSQRRFITICLSSGPNSLQYEHFRLDVSCANVLCLS